MPLSSDKSLSRGGSTEESQSNERSLSVDEPPLHDEPRSSEHTLSADQSSSFDRLLPDVDVVVDDAPIHASQPKQGTIYVDVAPIDATPPNEVAVDVDIELIDTSRPSNEHEPEPRICVSFNNDESVDVELTVEGVDDETRELRRARTDSDYTMSSVNSRVSIESTAVGEVADGVTRLERESFDNARTLNLSSNGVLELVDVALSAAGGLVDTHTPARSNGETVLGSHHERELNIGDSEDELKRRNSDKSSDSSGDKGTVSAVSERKLGDFDEHERERLLDIIRATTMSNPYESARQYFRDTFVIDPLDSDAYDNEWRTNPYPYGKKPFHKAHFTEMETLQLRTAEVLNGFKRREAFDVEGVRVLRCDHAPIRARRHRYRHPIGIGGDTSSMACARTITR